MLGPKLAFVFVCVLAMVAVSSESAADEGSSYPVGETHSRMSAKVVERLKKVLAASPGSKDVFAKVGDSITANPAFLSCFANDAKLGEHASLDTTLKYFSSHKVEGHSSFDRVSLSATPGWIAAQANTGSPSPLLKEIAAVKPAFAVVMLGTNDNRLDGLAAFTKNITEIVDRALAAGTVPILSTIPPRADSPAAAARVPALNAVIRNLAEARLIPLVDLNAALSKLAGSGLGADGIHLQMASEGQTPHGCWLTEDALKKGMNVRNLLTLQALDRARRFLVLDQKPEKVPSLPQG